MSTITLEKIQAKFDKTQAKQAELAQMIATFAASIPTTITIPAATIELKANERYCGRLLDAHGNFECDVVRVLLTSPKKLNFDDTQAFA